MPLPAVAQWRLRASRCFENRWRICLYHSTPVARSTRSAWLPLEYPPSHLIGSYARCNKYFWNEPDERRAQLLALQVLSESDCFFLKKTLKSNEIRPYDVSKVSST